MVVHTMQALQGHPGAQILCCMALMALARGEGELCQGNQWAVAKVFTSSSF